VCPVVHRITRAFTLATLHGVCAQCPQHYEGTIRNAGKAYAIADACQQACPASLELMRADGPEQRCNKARLLHYLPMRSNPTRKDSWCGWHLDHGMLTGTLLNMPHRVCAVCLHADAQRGMSRVIHELTSHIHSHDLTAHHVQHVVHGVALKVQVSIDADAACYRPHCCNVS
jgi:hypothetical protein